MPADLVGVMVFEGRGEGEEEVEELVGRLIGEVGREKDIGSVVVAHGKGLVVILSGPLGMAPLGGWGRLWDGEDFEIEFLIELRRFALQRGIE